MVEHCLSELPESIGELKLLQSLNIFNCRKLESTLPVQPVKRSTRAYMDLFVFRPAKLTGRVQILGVIEFAVV